MRDLFFFYFLFGIKMSVNNFAVTRHLFRCVYFTDRQRLFLNLYLQSASKLLKPIPLLVPPICQNMVPAKGLCSHFKGQNQNMREREHSCTTVITVIESSCFLGCIFQPRGPFSHYSFSYILRNVSLIVLHNPNLLCTPKGPIVPLIKRVLDKQMPLCCLSLTYFFCEAQSA